MKNLRNKCSGMGGGGGLESAREERVNMYNLIKCINIQHFDFN